MRDPVTSLSESGSGFIGKLQKKTPELLCVQCPGSDGWMDEAMGRWRAEVTCGTGWEVTSPEVPGDRAVAQHLGVAGS